MLRLSAVRVGAEMDLLPMEADRPQGMEQQIEVEGEEQKMMGEDLLVLEVLVWSSFDTQQYH